MLERVKLVLIKQKEEELRKKQSIKTQIDHLTKEQKNEDFREIDKKISNLENQINNLQTNFFKRILNGNLLKQLYSDYINLARSKTEKIDHYNNQVNQLLVELHDFVHDEVLIENEIERIKKATTFEELGLTEEKAKELLSNIIPIEKQTTIQKIFSEVLLANPTTKDDIYKLNQKLHQTNSSPYVLEMQKIESKELMNQLLEIGIVIEEEKIKFLKELDTYTKDLSKSKIPDIQLIDRTDPLDVYYCNEVEQALNNMMRYQNPSSIAVSEMKTLSVLVSVAKENNKEKTSQK